MQVFEFRETPQPVIIMDYYRLGSVSKAEIGDEDSYISVLGQVLDGLKHLHAKGVVHRDLKPENLLLEKEPFFKIVISDFGLSNIATETTLLNTFCGTARYAAPEVFPFEGYGYGPSVDIWSLGVIILENIYGIPDTPKVPTPNRGEKFVRADMWHQWITSWAHQLLRKLEDEEDGPLIDILSNMIKVKARERWPASGCLRRGLQNGLFRRREADGLIVNARDLADMVREESDEEKARKPTAASPQQEHSTERRVDPNETIVEETLWP